MKILIVDDELRIREVIKEYAKVNQMECKEACNGLEALSLLQKEDFDCIILDIMMPELDGFSTLKRIKSLYTTPVIMLSARQEEYDKLYSFETGVDDYVAKPFSPKELMARIKAIIARSGSLQTERYCVGDFCLDIAGRSLEIEKEKVLLTPKEMDLLIYLIKNRGIALDRQQLLNAVWNYDYSGDDRTVDTHIKMLRHNLGKYRDFIVTVRGTGYKFEI